MKMKNRLKKENGVTIVPDELEFSVTTPKTERDLRDAIEQLFLFENLENITITITENGGSITVKEKKNE